MSYLDEYRAAYEDDPELNRLQRMTAQIRRRHPRRGSSDNTRPPLATPPDPDAGKVCLTCGRPADESTCIEPPS